MASRGRYANAKPDWIYGRDIRMWIQMLLIGPAGRNRRAREASCDDTNHVLIDDGWVGKS